MNDTSQSKDCSEVDKDRVEGMSRSPLGLNGGRGGPPGLPSRK